MTEEAGNETELGFGAAVGLRFEVGLFVDFSAKLGGDDVAFEDLVLPVGEIGVEEVLADAEGADEGFPGEKRPVEPGC